MARRSLLATLVGAFLFALVAPASAQLPPPLFAFEHDASRDGTPNEIVSGFYGGNDDANRNGDPLDDRRPNSYETFEFTVPEGANAGSFTVHVQWENAQNDLDVYVYRKRPDGSIVPRNIAAAAAFGDNTEDAEYRPPVGNVEADTYLIVVDNWCTSVSDPGASPAACGFTTDTPDEDFFSGEVRLGPALVSNPLPSVSLAGPESGSVGQSLTFTATASDDEPIDNYAFDFDGDGRFEADNLLSSTASHRFERAGFVNVGVRVTDRDGDRAFASRKVVISGPAATVGAALKPLQGFKLNRPVFGGRKGRTLVVRYRLRERARVLVSLYRGRQRMRRLSRGSRRASRTFRIVVAPRGLRRATYTVRLSVRTASWKRQRARLSSRRL